jgi:hypothetical protein
MKTIKYAVVAGLLACVGCISATVSDSDVCSSKTVSFTEPTDVSTVCQSTDLVGAAGNASYTLPAQSTTLTEDLSDDLSKIDDVVNDLTLQVNQLALDNAGQLSFVSSIEIDIQGNDTTKFPLVKLAHYTSPTTGVGSMIDFTLDMPSQAVLQYLTAGPVQLTITMMSAPSTVAQACNAFNQGSLNTNLNLCVAVSGSFSKKL